VVTLGGSPSSGELLRRSRRTVGLAQEALAERTGRSGRGISDEEWADA
jgi:hypothetical protein